MCVNPNHAPGCQRLACWAPGIDWGKCPKLNGHNSQVYDLSIAPGVSCGSCGAYWIPEGVSRETLAAMKEDWEATQAAQLIA